MIIFLVDFEDSYTFNIAADWSLFNHFKLRVINHRDFVAKKMEIFYQEKSRVHFFLGPGPGHPQDYLKVLKKIQFILKKFNETKFLGVCLGHQMVLTLKNESVEKSLDPKHGRQELIELNKSWQKKLFIPINTITVQRYNSLGIIPLKTNRSSHLLSAMGESMVFQDERFYTYQFHPESIGTLNKKYYFESMLKWLFSS